MILPSIILSVDTIVSISPLYLLQMTRKRALSSEHTIIIWPVNSLATVIEDGCHGLWPVQKRSEEKMTVATQEIQVGMLAPSFQANSTHGEVSLASYRSRKHVVLYFMRALSCPVCQNHVKQLKDLFSTLQTQDATVLIIGAGSQDEATQLASRLQLPFALIADSQGELYQQYGFQKAFALIQKSGVVLIDKQGIMRYVHQVTNPMAGLNKEALMNNITRIAHQ